MPSNMKMPIIKVTPSSPSPDPNHPDYPEFFEDKLYLEHTKGIKKDERSDVEKNVSFDSFTLVLDPDESDDEDIFMEESLALTPNKSSLKMRRQHSVYNSSSDPGQEVMPTPPTTSCNNIHNSISIELLEFTDTVSNTSEFSQ